MGGINKTFDRRARSGLVTGGSRELDLQIAEAFSEQGAETGRMSLGLLEIRCLP